MPNFNHCMPFAILCVSIFMKIIENPLMSRHCRVATSMALAGPRNRKYPSNSSCHSFDWDEVINSSLVSFTDKQEVGLHTVGNSPWRSPNLALDITWLFCIEQVEETVCLEINSTISFRLRRSLHIRHWTRHLYQYPVHRSNKLSSTTVVLQSRVGRLFWRTVHTPRMSPLCPCLVDVKTQAFEASHHVRLLQVPKKRKWRQRKWRRRFQCGHGRCEYGQCYRQRELSRVQWQFGLELRLQQWRWIFGCVGSWQIWGSACGVWHADSGSGLQIPG